MHNISSMKLELYIILAFLFDMNLRIMNEKINSNIIPIKLNFIIIPTSFTIFKT